MSLRLLVFDDDLILHPEFLEGIAAEIHYRPNADRCLDDIQQTQPDMVLMDFSMQAQLCGLDAVELIRKHYTLEELAILAISSESRMNQLMLRAGANEACVKMALPSILPGLLKTMV